MATIAAGKAQGAARKAEVKAVGRTERAHKLEAESSLFSRTAADSMARFAAGASSAASSAHALPICMSCAELIYGLVLLNIWMSYGDVLGWYVTFVLSVSLPVSFALEWAEEHCMVLASPRIRIPRLVAF